MDGNRDEIERLYRSIARLEGRIETLTKDFNNDITELSVAVGVLNTKAGVWGFLGGLIPVVIAIAVQMLRGGQ